MFLSRPHHDGSPLHVSDQAPALGDTVTVSVRVPAAWPVTSVYARTTPDAEPRFTEAVVDRRTADTVWWRVPVEVRNPVTRYRFLLGMPGGYRWLTAAGVVDHDVPDATDFRLVAYDAPPAWAADQVVYQIFPDRFARSAAAGERKVPDWAVPCDWDTPVVGRGPETPYQFYGGDLDGIVEKLDHIQRLGATTVYLTPVFPARSNHRYDGASFDHVDPLLGGDAALARLADAVRARGMRLLGDLTTNHCGETHPWFAAAVSDVHSPERELFYFDEAGDYESWCGVKSLPKLDWGSAELRRRFFAGPDSITARWLSVLDGWRVDVANMTGRRAGDDHTHEVARLMRRAVVAARPDGLLLAEHAHDSTGDLDVDGWHGTMNYGGFTRPLWTWLRAAELGLPDFLGVPGGVPARTGPQAHATMTAFGALMSWRSRTNSWNLLDSHDSARFRTVVGGDPALVEVGAGLQMTMPGVPMVFAGDEIGVGGDNGEDARRPMPWHRPGSWDTATFERYRELIALRKGSETLRHGGLRFVHVDDDALVLARELGDETLLVAARRAAGDPVVLTGVTGAENVYGGAEATVADGSLTLPGDGPGFQVWRVSQDD